MQRNENSAENAAVILVLAIVLHVASAAISLTGRVPDLPLAQWLLVDAAAIIVLVLLRRMIRQRSKVVRWLSLPAVLISTPLVFPQQLATGSTWVISFALFQLIVQSLVALLLFQPDAVAWFKGQAGPSL